MEVIPTKAAAAGLSRCVRCRAYVDTNDERVPCHYHPGEYKNNPDINPVRSWSCCSNHEHNARGCTIADTHEWCVMTAAALDKFALADTDTAAANGLQNRRGGGGVPDESGQDEAEWVLLDAPKKKKTPTRPDGATEYTCGVSDTLASVALKHGMPTSLLKRWNPSLISGKLYPGQRIFVREPPPKSAADQRAAALRTLRAKAENELGAVVALQELEFYYDEAGGASEGSEGSVDRALEALRADHERVAEKPEC